MLQDHEYAFIFEKPLLSQGVDKSMQDVTEPVRSSLVIEQPCRWHDVISHCLAEKPQGLTACSAMVKGGMLLLFCRQ